jgi:hypothetical protein
LGLWEFRTNDEDIKNKKTWWSYKYWYFSKRSETRCMQYF